jgi:hypothetical protein
VNGGVDGIGTVVLLLCELLTELKGQTTVGTMTCDYPTDCSRDIFSFGAFQFRHVYR